MANQLSDANFLYQGPGRKRTYDMGPPGPGVPPGPPGFNDGFKRRKMEEVDYSEEPDEPPATLRILVRNQAAGGIIGKGGDNIKRLRKQVARDVEGERAMLEVQVLIPQPFMGTIIGTGGAKIKELRTRTRTNIKIFSEPMPSSNERSIQLMGSREQILECIQYFLDEISKKEPREPIYLYDPSSVGPSSGFGGEGEERFQPRGGGRGGGFRGGARGRGGPGRGGSFHSDVPVNQWSSQRGGHGGAGRGQRGRGQVPGMKPDGRPALGSTWTPPPVPQPGTFGALPSQPPPSTLPPSRPAPIPLQFPGLTPPRAAPNAPPPRPLVGSYPPPVAGGGVGYGMSQPTVGYTMTQPNPAQAPNNVTQPPRGGVPYMSALPPMGQVSQAAPPNPTPTQYGPPPAQQQPTAPPPAQQPTAPPTTQQVTIPNQYAEAIIGANGGTLQQIRAQSSCDISVEDLRPGASERIITIVGTPNGIQFAQQLMQNSVRQFHNV